MAYIHARVARYIWHLIGGVYDRSYNDKCNSCFPIDIGMVVINSVGCWPRIVGVDSVGGILMEDPKKVDIFTTEELDKWACGSCGQTPDPLSDRWRWAGDHWQHHHGYPAGHIPAELIKSQRKPRLFYWEDGVDAWCPSEELDPSVIMEYLENDGDIEEIRFMRRDMTDEQYDNLPEV